MLNGGNYVQLSSDKNSENFPVDGSSALEVETVSVAVPSGKKKKSRRKNKKNAVTYASETESNVNGIIKTDENIPEITVKEENLKTEKTNTISKPEPDKAEPKITPEIKEDPINSPEIKPTEPLPEIEKTTVSEAKDVFKGSVSTDIKLDKDEPVAVPDGSGIVYEVAEELYRKEKTQAELEALCHPPFTKIFTENQKATLDKEADDRTKRLVSAAAQAQAKDPTYLPDGLYEEIDKPIGTANAFLLELIMLIPVLNVIAAIICSFTGKTNKNIRSFSRGFLIWSVLFTLAVSAYLTVYFINSQIQNGNNGLLEVFNFFDI